MRPRSPAHRPDRRVGSQELPVLVLGASVAAAAAVLPFAAYLRRPDVVSLVAGLVMMGAGVVLVSVQAAPGAGRLTLFAGVAWFLPDLAATGVRSVDRALMAAALVHVAVLAHAALVAPAPRITGAGRRLAVASGYAAALSGVVGGYQVLLPLAGTAVLAAVLVVGRTAKPGADWGSAAGVVVGVGLLADAVARSGWGPEAGRWLEPAHAMWCAVAALLVARAGVVACRTSASAVYIGERGVVQLESALAAELGVPGRRVVFADGVGGWLDADGVRAAPSAGAEVRDASGSVVAVIGGDTVARLDPQLVAVLAMAAVNARLRRSVASLVEELAASRRRLLTASDIERQALAAQLRARCLRRLSGIEQHLREAPGLGAAADQATETRGRLEAIAWGMEPLAAGDGSLRRALQDLASGAACPVIVTRCDEPLEIQAARALWFCCAEAVSNTAKHAPGAVLRVTVTTGEGVVSASFGDDGPGGADPEGGGLRGVRDRVETLGGRVTLVSRVGGGTRLDVVLPDAADCGQQVAETPAGRDAVGDGPPYGHKHLLLEDVP